METITIRAFDNYFSANILLTRLRDAGIECYLKDEYTVTIDPLLSNALGGIKLIVRKENYKAAIKMLQSFEAEERIRVRCSICNHNTFSQIPSKNARNLASAVFGWLFFAPVTPEMVYKCNNCGHETETLCYQNPIDN